MKILHIIDSGGLYGAEVMLMHLMAEQTKMGVTPILASIGTPGEAEKAVEAEAQKRGLPVLKFRMRAGPNVLGAIQILKCAHQRKVALLHAHGYKANILFGSMPRMVRRIPLVATLHGWTWVGGLDRMLLYEWIESVSFCFADRVVIVNNALCRHPMLRKLARRSIAVVENGIPIDTPFNHSGLRPDIVQFARQGFTIGAIGRLSPEKGYDLLIDAFAELVAEGYDLYMVILGEGAERTALEKRAAEQGVGKRLLLPGYISEASHYLTLFKIFSMPSRTEGLPMVLLEAMAAGTPILATRVGGIARVLDDGRAGLLVEPGNQKGLKSALRSVLEEPTNIQDRVEKAKQRVLQKYSSRTMACRYQDIYRAVCAENHA